MRIKLIGFMLLCLMSQLAFASEFATNANANDEQPISISAWLSSQHNTTRNGQAETKPEYRVNEQITLTIEVATTGWFNQGTRIGLIELDNVIVNQRNLLATNFTQKINGKTWATQRWEVMLYPQTSGTFELASIPVSVSVSLPNGDKTVQQLNTQPLVFTASQPPGIQSIQDWFSATHANATQQWDMTNTSLQVGDTISRTIILKAEDSLSALLTPFLSSNMKMNSDSGRYQTYVSARQLQDSHSRGQYLSQQTEQITYVLQQGGDIVLPDLKVSWWNTQTQTMETLFLEGRTFAVKHTVASWLKEYGIYLVFCLLILVTLSLVSLKLQRYYRCHPRPDWFLFYQNVYYKRWGHSRRCLYKKLRNVTGHIEFEQAGITGNSKDNEQRLWYVKVWFNISIYRYKAVIAKQMKWRKAIPELADVDNK